MSFQPFIGPPKDLSVKESEGVQCWIRIKTFTFDSENQNLAFKMKKQLEKLSQVTKPLERKQDCTPLSDTGDMIMQSPAQPFSPGISVATLLYYCKFHGKKFHKDYIYPSYLHGDPSFMHQNTRLSRWEYRYNPSVRKCIVTSVCWTVRPLLYCSQRWKNVLWARRKLVKPTAGHLLFVVHTMLP